MMTWAIIAKAIVRISRRADRLEVTRRGAPAAGATEDEVDDSALDSESGGAGILVSAMEQQRPDGSGKAFGSVPFPAPGTHPWVPARLHPESGFLTWFFRDLGGGSVLSRQILAKRLKSTDFHLVCKGEALTLPPPTLIHRPLIEPSAPRLRRSVFLFELLELVT